MAKRPKQIQLPDVPEVTSVSELLPRVIPSGTIEGREGSIVREEPIQPTYGEYEASGWIEKYPLSSYIEYLIDWAFKQDRYEPGVDYLFQRDEFSEYFGAPGSTRVDFLFIQGEPWVALPVQGEFYHPWPGPIGEADMTVFIRLIVERGYIVIPLDESDILLDARKVLRDAIILGKNNSRYPI